MITKECLRCGKIIWGDTENEVNFLMMVHRNSKKCKNTQLNNKEGIQNG
jgi:hypothetical protein